MNAEIIYKFEVKFTTVKKYLECNVFNYTNLIKIFRLLYGFKKLKL